MTTPSSFGRRMTDVPVRLKPAQTTAGERGVGRDGERVELPGAALVVDELVLVRLGVVDVDAEVGRREREVVLVVHRAVGPRRENAPVREHGGLAVPADRQRRGRRARGYVGRQVHVRRVLLVDARVAGLIRVVVEADRILLMLKEVEGLSLKELEKIYKVNENALKVRLFRARQRVLKAFGASAKREQASQAGLE